MDKQKYTRLWLFAHEHDFLPNIFKHLQKIGLTDHAFGDLDIKIGISSLLITARTKCDLWGPNS